MATQRPEVDAVVIGVGLVGTVLSRALTRAGLKVVGLERGGARSTVPDFQGPHAHDELRFSVRKALMQDTSKETITFRHTVRDIAVPMRRWESFMPGTGVGGSMVHWNGQTFRFQDDDFQQHTRLVERYGNAFIPQDVSIQDWGVTAAELEPHFDRFEYLLGTSGKAGNLNGRIIPGGNPFEDPRSREYPTPPQKEPYGSAIFRRAAAGLGYHAYPQPSCNLSQPYTNPEGLTLNTCTFCGFCERYGCEQFAKSSPQTVLLPALLNDPDFELRTGCQVMRINLDSDGTRATGVTYVDASGREIVQPAALVILGAYALNNVRMLLLSGIGMPYDPATGQGVVGRNYAYQTVSNVEVFYDETININPFMRSGANGTVIADFAGDNFDHSALGFIGGAYIGEIMTNGRPIGFHPTPANTPKWGSAWKRAVARHYNHTSVLNVHGSSVATRHNYLDLDATYRDAWGLPLLRMTFDFPDNDIRMSAYVTRKAEEIGQAMGGQQVHATPRTTPYDVTEYQSTHNTGGAVMGTDPSTSVVNRYLQSWDVSNLFVIGASNFPQNASYNPTDTVGALAHWAADAVVSRYLRAPGPLMGA
ncbi:MAG: GMC family oxidoreductase [Longimicrobiales bacterium]